MARLRSLTGLLAVALASFLMLIWSWGTWPDPLVDCGTQLYVPWQLSQGKVLYRDIAYYNGPLSQYLNAAGFAIAGVSLRTLVLTNLAILSLTIILINRLVRRAAGSLAAAAAGVAFAVLFAFGQGVGVGNFNWVTPYTNEITHGTVLGLLVLACLGRYHRTARIFWLMLAGVALGLSFLTKAEPFAAAAAASAVQLLAGLWMKRAPARESLRVSGIFYACAIVMPLIAFGLLATRMPLRTAGIGVAGSWPWVFDSRVTSLPFYRRVLGMEDVGANLAAMLRWSLAYVALLVPALMLALRTPFAKQWKVSTAVFVLCGTLLGWQLAGTILGWPLCETDWGSMIRPLPICLLPALAAVAIPVLKRRETISGRSSLRLALVVFSLTIVVKILLNAQVSHYGFVLAMPGTLVLVAAVAQDLPDWVVLQGGSGNVLRAAGLAAGLAGAAATLYVDAGFFGTKRWDIAPGVDTFRGATRALEVQMMADLLRHTVPADGTVAVFPQGLMLNYLSRRTSPTRYINFMPPEVLAAGEPAILASLSDHPPDAIVINSSAVRDDQFTLDADYTYGRRTFAWIQENYEPAAVAELPSPFPTFLRLALMRRRVPSQ